LAVLLAVIAAARAVTVRSTAAFSTGVLFYALRQRVRLRRFSALVFFAIGCGAVSTKVAVLSSFGNPPVIYMTVLNGWSHDRYGSAGMLAMQALAVIVCILFASFAIARLQRRADVSPA
jgi:hypothetical protein